MITKEKVYILQTASGGWKVMLDWKVNKRPMLEPEPDMCINTREDATEKLAATLSGRYFFMQL